MRLFVQLCTAVGFVCIASMAALFLLVAWVSFVDPPLQAMRVRLRARRETRRAIAAVIEQSRSYVAGALPCDHFCGTGRVEIRDGVTSEFCTGCGQPFGAHRKAIR